MRNVRTSLLAITGILYAGGACALTVNPAESGVPSTAVVDESAPASDRHSLFNASVQPLPAETLPDLGSSAVTPKYSEKQLATIARNFGEEHLGNVSSGQFREQAETLALTQAARLVQQEAKALLSPLGTANLAFTVENGSLAGSTGQLFSPLWQSGTMTTFSQIGVIDKTDATLGNMGLGQRWAQGQWLLGYNAFLDRDFEEAQMRAGVGAEAWSDYLRFSANYYHPLSAMAAVPGSATQLRRQARGYDITTKGYLPFYRQLGASLSYEQYLGDQVDLMGNGTHQSNPVAMSLGVNYTPVPLVTLTAQHKQGESGTSQEQVGLSLNYRLGVPLSKQLTAENVAETRSLRGSQFDGVARNTTPVLEFRQRKTLGVFLATPPWTLQERETLPLKIQIRSSNRINGVSWQGDTQSLSLTPPANNRDPRGWSVIMPAWNPTSGASNSYRLSVTVVDDQQQRVTSNWITLTLAPPLNAEMNANSGLSFSE